MFMRLFQVKVNPAYTEQFKNFYEVSVFPQLQKMTGCIFAGLIKSGPDNNEYISITFWETLKNAEDFENSEIFNDLITKEKSFFSESNEWKIQLSDRMELEYAPVIEEPVVKKYSVELQKENGDKLVLKNPQMYLRIVSLKIQKNLIDEFKKFYLDKIIPALKETEGCRHVFLSENLIEKDEFISVTIWDSKKHVEDYEGGGKFKDLVEQIKHTFSQFYLWKIDLENEYNAKIKTTDDMQVKTYDLVTGKSFF
jgi:heme-degrading monooxygenase HmoA